MRENVFKETVVVKQVLDLLFVKLIKLPPFILHFTMIYLVHECVIEKQQGWGGNTNAYLEK